MLADRFSRETAAILVVGVALMADTLIYFMLVPLLPGYAARLALGPMGVGFLVWSYSAALLASTFPLGRFLETRGRRGPMLVGLGLLAVTTLVFGLTDRYPLLILARLCQGVAATLTWVAGMAVLADCTPPERRGRAMGTVFAFANFGLLAGPPLAGWLAEHWGPRSPFVAAAAIVVLDALARVTLLREPERRPGLPLGLWDLLKDPLIRTLALAMAVGAGLMTLLETVLPVHFAAERGLGPGLIGLMFGLSAGAHMATSPLMGALSDRHGRRRIMILGFAVVALVLPATALAGTRPLIGVAMVCMGITASFMMSPVSPALANAVDSRGSTSYASVFSILNLAYAVGMLVGPFLGSLLQTAFGLRGALLLLGAACLGFLPALRRVP